MKLMPCPHCGAPGKIKRINSPHMHGWIGCPECGIYKQWNHDPADAIKKWNTRTKTETGLYDLEEIYPDCTVQILRNTDTGETSIGWWPNDRPPKGVVRHEQT